MELSVRLVIVPKPRIRTKVLILIIIVVVLLVIWGVGGEPVAELPLILGTGLSGTQAVRALVAGGSPASRL